MSRIMAVLLDGIAQIEYDRGKPLPDYQAAYLEKMDLRMDAEGISVDGALVPAPDPMQKARFIAANLAHAIVSNHEAQAAAFATYLATRLADLKQVKLRRDDDGFAIELDFEQDYVKQHPVQLMPLKR